MPSNKDNTRIFVVCIIVDFSLGYCSLGSWGGLGGWAERAVVLETFYLLATLKI
jgi:hypothetical protein